MASRFNSFDMVTTQPHKIILASGSPRRKELLAMLDVEFRVDTSRSVEEIVPDGTAAEEVPAYLSRLKAAPYIESLTAEEILVTADTVVILNGQVIGKPKDAADAKAILHKLQGQTHIVVTGVTFATAALAPRTFTETTEVEFSPLTDEEIDYYVSHYKPFDKAGAYGIQEWIGAAAVKGMRGSFYNVMGLPVNRLYREFKAAGLDLQKSLSAQ